MKTNATHEVHILYRGRSHVKSLTTSAVENGVTREETVIIRNDIKGQQEVSEKKLKLIVRL